MPVKINNITVFAPAKVNLHLAILDKRQDGFHNLESVFLAVDFGDTLHFKLNNDECETENTEIEVIYDRNEARIEPFSIPLQDNIIFKAISLFREKTGFYQKIVAKVEKRIPIGSGLGGGSSDAAATLLALNKMAGFLCSHQDLLDMALTLGSDVPFFIHETSGSYVSNRGEKITPFKAPLMYLVLVNPGFSSDTAAAFRLLDEYRALNPTNVLNNNYVYFIPTCENFRNDFLQVFNESEKSVYCRIILQLQEAGADFVNLSGSGSTCFGVFKDAEHAQKAAVSINGNWKFVKMVKTFFMSC
ncbi:MAG: 4-(cytidine 5'-diphospho)-2-C-methyl-D-erythritol kinase [Treponema sp.]|nr:4-(cytidine 5'-diphospho)-2-C-methyl-D-erythritol kinase [Treponema sp.]